jgi:hypothetical protein
MGYFGCCFNCRVAWDGKMILRNKVIIFKSSGLLDGVVLKRLRWVQIWRCPFVTLHSTTKLHVAEWRCNCVFVTSTRVGDEPSSASRCRCAYGRKNWFRTWWRSDKFLLLPGVEPLITSQYDQRYPCFCKDWWKWWKNRQPESWHVLECSLMTKNKLVCVCGGAIHMWISVLHGYEKLIYVVMVFS